MSCYVVLLLDLAMSLTLPAYTLALLETLNPEPGPLPKAHHHASLSWRGTPNLLWISGFRGCGLSCIGHPLRKVSQRAYSCYKALYILAFASNEI